MLKIKKKDWIEIVLHIAFWAGVFYTLLSFTQPDIKMRINHNGSIIEEDIRHTISSHIFCTLGFLIVLFYGNIFWLFKKALRYKNVMVKVILPVAWFGFIFLADNYVDALLPAQKLQDAMIMAPPSKGMDSIKIKIKPDPDERPFIRDTNIDQVRVLKARPVPDIFVKSEIARQQSKAFIFQQDGFSNTLLFIFIIVFGLSIAYFFLKEWSRVEKMRSELAAVQLDTEVKFLKAQVNPHFLFNTLNNLFSMAQKKGNDDLADGISKLSGMMRYMIYESNEEKVPLKKEIEYLEDCILLNKLRYADKEAMVKFDYPSETDGIFIAPMLFIPFVENAFKHGVVIGQSSDIDISLSVNNNELSFTCTNADHSHVQKMNGDSSGVGLENVKRRLELLYPGKHQLQITKANNQYKVKLKINLQ
ncbi:MAG TPA: histidine kinase [Mucilaginibacter sp.]